VLGEVAQAIEQRNGVSNGQACVNAKTGGMSATDAGKLVAQAADQAGPYTVTITTSAPLIRTGASADLIATVTSAKGKPVPDVPVDFDTTSKDIDLSRKSATTGPDGKATVLVTLKAAHDGSVPVSAKAMIASGLTRISQVGSVDALVLSAPTAFTGTGQVVISTKADPVLSPGADTPGVPVGVPFTPSVGVSGMNGHTGTVSMTVYGPLPVPKGGLCTALKATDWQSAVTKDSGGKLVAQSSTANIVGDSVVKSDPLTVKAPGCFFVTASVTTLDSEPNVTRKSDFSNGGASVTVLDTVVTAALDHSGVISPGDPMSLTLSVAKSHGWTTNIDAKLEGPVKTPINGCLAADWTSARQVWADTFQNVGDGKASFKSTPLAKIGCYRLTGLVRIDTGTGLVATFPLPLPNGVAGVLVLSPRILEALPDATSAVIPKTINDNVFVSGLAGQPGKLTIELYQAPWGGTPGCDKVDWTKAKKIAAGAATPLTGDGWHTAPSPATSAAGCISLVPVITLDANPAVTTRGAVGARYSSIIVAAPDQKPFSLQQGRSESTGYIQSHAAVVGAFILGGIAFAAIAATLISMSSSRHAEMIDDRRQEREEGNPFDDETGSNPFEHTGEIPDFVGGRPD
jgi:hypothetical protein